MPDKKPYAFKIIGNPYLAADGSFEYELSFADLFSAEESQASVNNPDIARMDRMIRTTTNN
jgi:hypothetical protein